LDTKVGPAGTARDREGQRVPERIYKNIIIITCLMRRSRPTMLFLLNCTLDFLRLPLKITVFVRKV
jgi:hypothetical protein